MSEQKSEATQSDESQVSDFDFDALADDVLGYDETATQESEEDTEGLVDGDPTVAEDADEVDEVEEDNTDDEVEDEDESEDATQEEETDEDEDYEIDMDFTVPVKIDGETSKVSMEELIANYQTKQSQSKKGDELAEQAKELEQVKEGSMMFANINAQLLQNEDQKDIKVLQGMQEKVDKAYEDDDYDAAKLNRKFEKAKEEYGRRKNGRDGLLQNMGQKIQGQQVEAFNKQVEHFQSVIPDVIPDWSEDLAQKNREFALGLGLQESFVDSITDPAMVKILDDYRRLRGTTTKGAVKRKKAAVKRVPTKKPVSAKNKKSNKVDDSRRKVNKGRGNERDDEILFDAAIDNLFDG